MDEDEDENPYKALHYTVYYGHDCSVCEERVRVAMASGFLLGVSCCAVATILSAVVVLFIRRVQMGE
jgi:hypothetical protein